MLFHRCCFTLSDRSCPLPPRHAVHGGSPAVRLRSCVLGAALGASVGVPAGLMHDKLVQLMPEDQRQQRQERLEQTEAIIRGDSESCWSWCWWVRGWQARLG